MTLPAVDFPQPLSPTSPRVSLSLISKEIPSTALTVPTCLRKTPLVMGKCYERFSTLSKVSEELFMWKKFLFLYSTNTQLGVQGPSSRASDFRFGTFPTHVCNAGQRDRNRGYYGDPEVVP